MRIHSGKIANMINLTSIKEFEVLVKYLPIKAINDTNDFTGNFTKYFRKD